MKTKSGGGERKKRGGRTTKEKRVLTAQGRLVLF